MHTIPQKYQAARLLCMVITCLGVPLMLCGFVGPVAGALGASGAAGLWHWQYRFPTWQARGGSSFWYVAAGYGVIGLTLLVCLGRLLR